MAPTKLGRVDKRADHERSVECRIGTGVGSASSISTLPLN